MPILLEVALILLKQFLRQGEFEENMPYVPMDPQQLQAIEEYDVAIQQMASIALTIPKEPIELINPSNSIDTLYEEESLFGG